MQNLLDELKDLLQQDERLVVDGKLLKNKITELGLQLDPSLIKMLLFQPSIKKHFFQEVEDVLVFDKIKFQKFVSNKAFLPDSYTSFKNKIGLTADDEFIAESKEVVLAWPYKDCVLEGGQTKEDTKRDEIFWNEILAPDEIDRLLDPKVLTNFKKYDKYGEHPVTDISLQDNFIIKGNNLLALHSLKKVYANKIKLIYIDPPYNTGNDSFLYNDSFNHSAWLTFMKNRLEVAKELLRDDGVIFISCDDNEQAYLKVICDDTFKRDNFIATMPWRGRGGRQDATHVSDIHEFILFYAKNYKSFNAGASIKQNENFSKYDEQKKLNYKTQLLRKWGSNSRREDRPKLFYPIPAPDGSMVYPKLPNGDDGCWRWTASKALKEIEDGNVEFIKQNGECIAYQKIYEPKEGEFRTKKFTTWLDNIGTTANGSIELKNLMGEKVFNYPKPVSLVKHLIKIANLDDEDYILDFFAGSGTTAQAVLDFNKEEGIRFNFILCEQMSYINDITVKRVQKILENESFIYCELAEANQAFIDQIQSATKTEELKTIWEAMKEKAFLSYKINPKQIDLKVTEFEGLSFEDQQKFLIEVLDKNMLYVPYSEIEDETYAIPQEVKALNRKFYSL